MRGGYCISHCASTQPALKSLFHACLEKEKCDRMSSLRAVRRAGNKAGRCSSFCSYGG